MRWLAERGFTRLELLQAALLHDVGKSSAPINLAERVEAVLVRWLLPGCYARWAQAEPRGGANHLSPPRIILPGAPTWLNRPAPPPRWSASFAGIRTKTARP